MRRSLLCLAIATTLLAACGQSRTSVREEAPEALAEAGRDQAARQRADEQDAEAAKAAAVAAPAIVYADPASAQGAVANQPQSFLSAPPPPPAPMPSQRVQVVGGGLVNAIDVSSVESRTILTAEQIAKIGQEPNTEKYEAIEDNPTHRVAETPVSTFSIDVDTGSYSNVRRMLMAGQRPPADAVRAEEMINYFDYGYATPGDRATPFRVSTEIAPAPWNSKHQLLQIGIQGYDVPKAQIPASNLVFLIDTSGSMQSQDKLPLLKASFAELVKQLRPQDRVSMVVYAGSAGLVLPPTSGADKETILAALDRLEAGGSTNGGQGLQLAYAQAKASYMKNGVNRVILATDGDFNVGTYDQKALETMIADQRKSGIALTTLGFGTGNYNDAMAEQLADIGDGNHAYIDSLNEGRKVLVEELSSTMLTIAQDVKIQLEFNPAVVAEYRLIGYENRALRREDFNNDKIDAGEIGAGHDVTALYEITLVGSGGESVDPLRYGRRTAVAAGKADEIGLLRLRYKQPGAETSRLIETPLQRSQIQAKASPRLRWAAAIAAYADLLRGGKNVGRFDWNDVRTLATGLADQDRWGYRAEFLQLVDRARSVTGGGTPVAVSE
ncbi:vWA domain-containing protein [Arenimonas sp.]|uniref:vWA domain-containing protein n=1 Tax=Arenimonas sp. TaxID=1872635 RepID=UPI0039E70D41